MQDCTNKDDEHQNLAPSALALEQEARAAEAEFGEDSLRDMLAVSHAIDVVPEGALPWGTVRRLNRLQRKCVENGLSVFGTPRL